MRKPPPALLALVLWPAVVPARAADDPRALVQRAVGAAGGAGGLGRHLAVRVKLRGKLHLEVGNAQAIPVEGELTQSSGRFKLAFRMELFGTRRSAAVVLDGDKSWRDIDGQIQDMSAEERASLKTAVYQDRVTGLVALLKDKGFSLAPLDEVRIDGRPARGVQVSYKGQPDTSLYFDNETGLLVKYAYRAKKTGDTKEALHETVLSDYREPDLAAADEKALREAKVGVTGPALLAFVRRQTPNPADLEKARALIRKLGDDAFAVREKATADLVELGAVAIPLLRQARKDPDREVARRADQCLQQVGEPTNTETVAAAVRLLGLRRPAGAAEVLLAYLPGADESVAREVRAVLFALAGAGPVPEPGLVKALGDTDPVRRSAAAAALGRDGGAYAKLPGRRLFVRGLRQAMKNRTWVEGKLQMEMEVFGHQFFNQFDDKEFAKP